MEKTDAGLTVKRELEDGWFQEIELPLPAVLTIQSGGNKLRYATLMGIKRAKTKEMRVVTASELGQDAAAGRGPGKHRAAAEAKIHADYCRRCQTGRRNPGRKTQVRGARAMSGIWVVLEDRDGRIGRASWEALSSRPSVWPSSPASR